VWGIASSATIENGSGLRQIAADPHDVLAWVLVSTGIVGLALFAWLLVEIVHRWRSSTDSAARPTQSAARAGILMYALIGMSAPLHVQTWPLAALVLGASLGRTPAGQGDLSAGASLTARRAIRLATALLTAAAAVLLSAFAVSRLVAVPTSREYVEPGALSGVAAMWRYDPYLFYRSGVSWREYYARNGRPAGEHRDLDAFERAFSLEPNNGVYAAEVASSLGETGASYVDVQQAFADALRLFPVSPDTHATYAEYLLGRGDLEAARSQLDAVNWATDSIPVLSAELRYAHAAGDERGAADLAARLLEARRLMNAWVPWP
jgi:hypothetical protein